MMILLTEIMGGSTSKEEKEVIIAQAGNSGAAKLDEFIDAIEIPSGIDSDTSGGEDAAEEDTIFNNFTTEEALAQSKEFEDTIASDFESDDELPLAEYIRRSVVEWERQIGVWPTIEKCTETGGPNIPDNTETPLDFFYAYFLKIYLKS
ncbi:hypothetical protein QE152_g31381 [Popillia japonica]|uniref:Uncharacterized protein n=1 Tax=Popillia japonica TaxID=7064 RepID=A0AAW1J1E0_POPJA